MQERFRGEASKTTMICVDSYEQGVFSGRFYNFGQDDGCSFHSLTQFLVRMENLLNSMNCPQPFTEMRSFVPAQELRMERPADSQFKKGCLATFIMKVIVRQHTSWQGTITWMEKKEEQSFRSVLKLILLMDNALSGSQEVCRSVKIS